MNVLQGVPERGEAPPPTVKYLRTQLFAGLVWVGISIAIGIFTPVSTLRCERAGAVVNCAVASKLWGVLPFDFSSMEDVRSVEVEVNSQSSGKFATYHWLTLHGSQGSFSPMALSNRPETYETRDLVQTFLDTPSRSLLEIHQPRSLVPNSGDRIFFWVSILFGIFGLTYALPLLPAVRRSHASKYNVTYRWRPGRQSGSE